MTPFFMQKKHIPLEEVFEILLSAARQVEAESIMLDLYKIDFESITSVSDLPKIIRKMHEVGYQQGRVSGCLDLLNDLKKKLIDDNQEG